MGGGLSVSGIGNRKIPVTCVFCRETLNKNTQNQKQIQNSKLVLSSHIMALHKVIL